VKYRDEGWEAKKCQCGGDEYDLCNPARIGAKSLGE
jgi:hypothetical protein